MLKFLALIRRPTLSENIYLLGLSLLAAALPFSMFLMSVSQFILLAGWIIGGNYREKLGRFWQNKPAVVFSSIYFLHLIGFAYTSDINAGLNDLRVKLPLLILPFAISGMPGISRKNLSVLLWVFVASVIVNTLIVSFNGSWLFISPIRFSMMACFAFFVLLYFFASQNEIWKKAGLVVSLSWLGVFLFRWQYETGIVTFISGLFFTPFYLCFRVRKHSLKIALAVWMAAIPLVVSVIVYSAVKNFYENVASEIISPNEVTANGEPYEHHPDRKDLENGNYTWRYIAQNELKNAWSQRSELEIEGTDKRGNQLRATLIRFLTSKGLKKDEDGVTRLTDDEVKAVETGIANVRYMDGMSLEDRLYETIWSIYHYHIGNNPQDNSVTQRFEFWKAGWGAFFEAPVFGHGTGSVKFSLDKQYEAIKTPLDKRHRMKTHNQYLSTAVALGGVGFAWLLLSLLFPLFCERNYSNYLFAVFLLIVMIAMLVEDTLETQAGVTFTAFFISLLLFSRGDVRQ